MVLIVGCAGGRPLVYDVDVQPRVISPNADGVDDVARVTYKISRQCRLYIYFVDAEGTEYRYRDGNRRSPGEYEALFGGAIEGQVLADGQYTWVVEVADDASGQTERVEGQLAVTDADSSGPELQDFTVFPQVFTPNQDGINDRIAISFRLLEQAEVEVYLRDKEGDRYPVGLPKTRWDEEQFDLEESPSKVALEPGLWEYDYDGGIDLGASPPADGEYTVVAVAIDQAGNHVVKEAPLTIEDGGLPLGEIQTVEFYPTVVPLGGTLHLTVTVENVGGVAIRTKGPASGTTYTSRENFNTLGFYEEPGIFRVGVDFEGNTDGRPYTYRWQLGRDEDLEERIIDGQRYLYLLPGQRVTVVGHITIIDEPPKINPYYWAGLVHEQVRIVNDRQDPTEISIGF
ncbi:MAG: hypothetical protein CEE40_09225 [Chloroflexi bacterium B3_Chlor]|nr:MAG: hypothetical protein CEE40_09225 [Chloroflexi bacterium B3_Chlor]